MTLPSGKELASARPNSEGSKVDVVKLLGPIVVGAVTGVLGTIGLLLTPLQKSIFNWLWKEQPSMKISFDEPAGVMDGDIVGLNIVVAPETVVGLSPGTLTVSFTDQTGARLLKDSDGQTEVSSLTMPLEKADAPTLVRLRVVARVPGRAVVSAAASSPRWANPVTQTAQLDVIPRPSEKCKWDRNEHFRSFTGEWNFEVPQYGTVKLVMHEDTHQQLTGVFETSKKEQGRIVEAKRDGDVFWGDLVYDADPLHKLYFTANYERSPDGGFVRSTGGKLETKSRVNAKTFDWKTDKTLTFFGFCTLR
jgi:hypothetical protein